MIQKKTIEYEDLNKKIYEGVLVYDDKNESKKPCILVTHTFKGLQEFEIQKAIDLAKMGFVAFAVDLYGKGIRGNTVDEASSLMQELNKDRKSLLDRMLLAFDLVQSFEQVDKKKIAAIGFCFGGKCVLDLARSRTNIKGVVSFNGLYDKPNLDSTKEIIASILVLHGWEDPLAPVQMVLDLKEEITKRNADFQFLAFSQTGHSFTNPQANFVDAGMFFQQKSNQRAWLSMTNFLK
jgi:dienelactone hydrolase